MGIFSIFKKPVKIQDKNFGELAVVGSKKNADYLFEGRGFFNEDNKNVGYTIYADDASPTAQHHLFYENLQDNYPSIIEKIILLIVSEFRNWKEDFAILDFSKEFRVDYITIPKQNTKPLAWEMSFTTVHDKNHWIAIDFIDFEPNGVLVDG